MFFNVIRLLAFGICTRMYRTQVHPAASIQSVPNWLSLTYIYYCRYFHCDKVIPAFFLVNIDGKNSSWLSWCVLDLEGYFHTLAILEMCYILSFYMQQNRSVNGLLTHFLMQNPVANSVFLCRGQWLSYDINLYFLNGTLYID